VHRLKERRERERVNGVRKRVSKGKREEDELTHLLLLLLRYSNTCMTESVSLQTQNDQV
jgi:hypothetical protein